MKTTTSFQLICENCDGRFAKTLTNTFQRFCCWQCETNYHHPNGKPIAQHPLSGTNLSFVPNDLELRRSQVPPRLFEQHGTKLIVSALAPI